MLTYIIRRLLLIPIVLLGIMVANFFIIQIAPGGPVEQAISQISGTAVDATARIGGTGQGETGQGAGQSSPNAGQTSGTGGYRGARGLDPDLVKEIEIQFGFDKPLHLRFWIMLKNFLAFDFGESFFQSKSVVDLVPAWLRTTH